MRRFPFSKEIMVKASSRRNALVKLLALFEEYRRRHNVKDWDWRTPPETMNYGHNDAAAYGRITCKG
jgi:hypothetical protein